MLLRIKVELNLGTLKCAQKKISADSLSLAGWLVLKLTKKECERVMIKKNFLLVGGQRFT
jgi:hypothetical protein